MNSATHRCIESLEYSLGSPTYPRPFEINLPRRFEAKKLIFPQGKLETDDVIVITEKEARARKKVSSIGEILTIVLPVPPPSLISALRFPPCPPPAQPSTPPTDPLLSPSSTPTAIIFSVLRQQLSHPPTVVFSLCCSLRAPRLFPCTHLSLLLWRSN